MKSKLIYSSLLVIGFLAGATALSTFASSWSAPTQAPPACPAGSPGCDAPLNVGSSAQSKNGSLTVNAADTFATGLKLFGNIQIIDSNFTSGANNNAIGKILTTDQNGVGSWKGMIRLFANLKTSAGNNSATLEYIGVLEPGTYTFSGKFSTLNQGGGGFAGVFMDDSDSLTWATAGSKLSAIYGAPVTSGSGPSYIANYNASNPDTIFVLKRNGYNDGNFTLTDTTVTITNRKFVYIYTGQSYMSGYVFAR